MQKAFVRGIGQIKVTEHWDKSLRDMAGDAAIIALEDAGISQVDGIFVGNMLSGPATKQIHLGTLIADWLGITNAESINIEAACASGSAAFRNAVLAISSGQMRVALVIGVEKMTDSPSAEITSSLATAADADLEVDMGLSFVALNALIMQRYMHEYQWETKDFGAFSINAHANAVFNPFARFRKAINQKIFDDSPAICDPINLMDASSIGDGAAAIILTSADTLSTSNGKISVVGSSSSTDTISLQNRGDPLWLSAAERSSKSAFQQAGLVPSDIGVFEYHDAFSIMAALSLEACGFCERGQGPRLANEGEISINGSIPVATRGGLKARGHPVGATGIYQLVEVVQQLRGVCGETQVLRNDYGMTQNIGGSGSNIITHILKRE
ncbi:MAG: thiolase domain-containing protein [Anaerolineaceae bacterium]|nr:thiolase domain-containing protein [Anaerolineaceae bacterium]